MTRTTKQIFNPFLPLNVCIPDGEPHVFGERIYLFGSHDKAGGETFCMLPYEFWSAPVGDLSAWTSKGVNYRAEQDPYAKGREYCYAPDCIRGRDGRYYLYYCLSGKRGAGGYDGPISVAVSDAPDGKYEYYGFVKNADGTPFDECVVFDPALLDDDGTIRLYGGTEIWGGLRITPLNRPILSRVAAAIYHRNISQFKAVDNPLGPFMLELCEDMLTVKKVTKHILPVPTKENGFKGHMFFEGASVRKINGVYYFIYSSQRNHELCYATSKFPDKDFVFRGTIISNGDVGLEGRKEKDRLNHTATNHGSIEKINGQWYVFYHRQTCGNDFSRQACAERIEILPDGSIPQVEVTSCGLNGGSLRGDGTYSAAICCNLTNGKMPHGGNRNFSGIPTVVFKGGKTFVENMKKGAIARYKYFDLSRLSAITLTASGGGVIVAKASGKRLCCFAVNSALPVAVTAKAACSDKRSALEFEVIKGRIDLFEFELKSDNTEV